MDTLATLSEDTKKEIQNAIEQKADEKAQLQVEKALMEQDEKYSSKLKQLLEAIDKDHVKKLKRVVEAIEVDKTAKLKKVVKKYEQALNEDAKTFKNELLESISNYLDTYLDEVIPAEEIKAAVRNKKALSALETMRNFLAVDTAVQKESIKQAIIDGKNQINEASTKLESVVTENSALKNELAKTKAAMIIEQRTANLSDQQKKYVKQVFANKSAEFIGENFDYTLKLFDRKVNDRLENLKEEALKSHETVDRVVLEQKDDRPAAPVNPYLTELRKY